MPPMQALQERRAPQSIIAFHDQQRYASNTKCAVSERPQTA
jgi:hypothetical protein